MKLELPESKSATTEQIKDLALEIKADGAMFLNQEPVTLENLEQQFKKFLPDLEEKSLILRADKNVPHGTVVKVMDLAKLSGMEKLIIATQVERDVN